MLNSFLICHLCSGQCYDQARNSETERQLVQIITGDMMMIIWEETYSSFIKNVTKCLTRRSKTKILKADKADMAQCITSAPEYASDVLSALLPTFLHRWLGISSIRRLRCGDMPLCSLWLIRIKQGHHLTFVWASTSIKKHQRYGEPFCSQNQIITHSFYQLRMYKRHCLISTTLLRDTALYKSALGLLFWGTQDG